LPFIKGAIDSSFHLTREAGSRKVHLPMLRTLFIAVFLSLYTLVVGPLLLLYTWVTHNPGPIYWAGVKGVLFFVRAVGVRVRVRGLERIPRGVCLFVANHTSSADAPAVVGAIPRRIAILLKESLFKWPIVGQVFLSAHFIPVNRSVRESALASVEKATEALKAGQSLLIYPEGTRSPDGRLQEFKKGAVVMAIKAGVPIVPMACSGAHRIMEKRSLVIHAGEIVVEFLDPIDTSAYSLEQRDILNEKVREALAAGLPPDQRPLDSPGTVAEQSVS
jgi:1-acyl-sn-glycerol-3-phosphate acyltransferase